MAIDSALISKIIANKISHQELLNQKINPTTCIGKLREHILKLEDKGLCYMAIQNAIGEGVKGEEHILYQLAKNHDELSAFQSELESLKRDIVIEGNQLLEVKDDSNIGSHFTVPEGITVVGDHAFLNCSNLSITLPQSVTYIDKFAFQYCNNLTTITIPQSVTYIGKGAFFKCSNLTSITLPLDVTQIGDFAFGRCINLASITIPQSVNHIGDFAFFYCTNLISITLPQSITHIGDFAFYQCNNLTNITIPPSVNHIGESTFSYCSNLTSITLPQSVNQIGDGAFDDCSKLTNIIIPQGITHIGDEAFSKCSSLTNINIDTDNINEINRIKQLLPQELHDKIRTLSDYKKTQKVRDDVLSEYFDDFRAYPAFANLSKLPFFKNNITSTSTVNKCLSKFMRDENPYFIKAKDEMTLLAIPKNSDKKALGEYEKAIETIAKKYNHQKNLKIANLHLMQLVKHLSNLESSKYLDTYRKKILEELKSFSKKINSENCSSEQAKTHAQSVLKNITAITNKYSKRLASGDKFIEAVRAIADFFIIISNLLIVPAVAQLIYYKKNQHFFFLSRQNSINKNRKKQLKGEIESKMTEFHTQIEPLFG